MHESIEVPEPPEILVLLRVHVRFVEFVVTPSETVPENPLIGATVIVDVPAVPATVVTLVGLAVIVKSGATSWMLTTNILWNGPIEKVTKKLVPSVVEVNGVLVPLINTCSALMLGTDETGIVTVANAVVPVWPDAVKPMFVAFAATFEIVASLLIEQPVPHEV